MLFVHVNKSKHKSHRLADACIPRTSHFHCSFSFALVLHNWNISNCINKCNIWLWSVLLGTVTEVNAALLYESRNYVNVKEGWYLSRASLSSSPLSSLVGYGAGLRNRRSGGALHNKRKTFVSFIKCEIYSYFKEASRPSPRTILFLRYSCSIAFCAC